jgi:DNA polymerase-3 subunit alpha
VNLEPALARLRAFGVAVDVARIPADAPEAFRLFAEGDTEGIARFDHEDALGHLRRLAPDRMAHLVAFQALNRMAALAAGLADRYIERRHGREAPGCGIPELDGFFAGTLGIPLFPEQVEAVAREVAGMDEAEAARFASAFRRFDEAAMPGMADRFVEGAGRNGTPEPLAREMCAFLARSAPFTLPERLLAGFALEGYRLAWIKARHRESFDAALAAEREVAAPAPA